MPAQIPLLTMGNYDTWKTRMEMQLIRDRLWAIVCGRRTRPSGGEGPTQAQHEFDDEAERAVATIFLHLDETAERLVRDVRDPVELWKRLKDMYSSTGFCNRFAVWRKLFRTNLREYASMHEYVDSIEASRRQLRDAGFEVPDEVLAAVLLKGLPAAYNDFVASVTEAYELAETVRYDGLVVRLAKESKRLEEEKKSEPVVATGGRKPASSTASAKDQATRCNNCGKKGHKVKECWTRTREQENHLTGGDINWEPTQPAVLW